MSYYMMNGGGLPASMSGFGYGLGNWGFGAISFSSETVWSDWLLGASGSPPGTGPGAGAAGKRAANAIRAALGQLGFGSGQTIDASWGTASDKSSYTNFAQQEGIPAPAGLPIWWPSKTGIFKLGELVKAGAVVGDQPVQEFHEVAGQMVPGAKPGAKPIVAKAGLSTGAMLGIGALALVAVGAIALVAAKKKPSGPPSQRASAPVTKAA